MFHIGGLLESNPQANEVSIYVIGEGGRLCI